jgi:SAM-dependent methyltransferase
MYIHRNNCAICSNELKNIYVQENVPIQLSCTGNNTNYDYSNMSFSQCVTCSTIQLDKLIPLHILYSNSHNYVSVGEVWKGYFELFNDNIDKIINNKNVLEVGCPSGKLALSHDNYKKWYIVEPNKNKMIDFNEKIVFIESFFDENFTINDSVDIIVHSHLFEHIYEPNSFLKQCYNILNDDGEMYFGLPNMEYIAEQNLSLFLGIFFEHTIFLNKDNIIYLLIQNGFEIKNIIDYQTHSILFHVKKVKHIIKSEPKIITNYYDNFINFMKEFTSCVNNYNTIIEKTNKPVYIFGASYNTQLLLTMDINKDKIIGILDNCKNKHNKYLYGYDLKIYSPEIVKNNECIVIVKAGYYSNEIKEQLKIINKNIEII